MQILWPNLSCFVSHQNWQAHLSKDRSCKAPCAHCGGPNTCGKTWQDAKLALKPLNHALYHVTVTLCFLMRHDIFSFYPSTLIATTTRNELDLRRRHFTSSNYGKERPIKPLRHYLTPEVEVQHHLWHPSTWSGKVKVNSSLTVHHEPPSYRAYILMYQRMAARAHAGQIREVHSPESGE